MQQKRWNMIETWSLLVDYQPLCLFSLLSLHWCCAVLFSCLLPTNSFRSMHKNVIKMAKEHQSIWVVVGKFSFLCVSIVDGFDVFHMYPVPTSMVNTKQVAATSKYPSTGLHSRGHFICTLSYTHQTGHTLGHEGEIFTYCSSVWCVMSLNSYQQSFFFSLFSQTHFLFSFPPFRRPFVTAPQTLAVWQVVWFLSCYQRGCFLSFPRKQFVSRWHGADSPAGLCSSSRWVIYAWRWAPKVAPSLCHFPSAKLGPWWDINPSWTPWQTPDDNIFSSFPWKYTLWFPLTWAAVFPYLPSLAQV